MLNPKNGSPRPAEKNESANTTSHSEYNSYKRILGSQNSTAFQSEHGSVFINLWPDGSITVNSFSLDRVVTKYTITPEKINCECYVAGRQKLPGETGNSDWIPEKPEKPRFTLIQLAVEYHKKFDAERLKKQSTCQTPPQTTRTK